MRILLSTKDISIEKWREIRKQSLGGSDASVVLGLNKWKSAYTLWAEKKHLINDDDKDNEAMRIGRDLEDYVAKRFTEATGKKIRKRNFMFMHDDYDFITANIDREVVGENAGLECKTTSVFSKSDFENGEIPLYYYCQCMHYMAVMGYDKMYLAILVLGQAFYYFEINRDETEIENLINAEVKWWNRYILKDEIPEVDGSGSTDVTINKMYHSDDSSVIFDSSIKSDVENYINLKTRIKELENSVNEYEQKIKAVIKNAEKCFVGNQYEVIWKNKTINRIDTKRLKSEKAEIYNEFLKETSSRLFKIKEVK